MPNTTLKEAMAGAEITVEETPVCVINAETRAISVPDEYRFFGVSSDEKVKRIYFKLAFIQSGVLFNICSIARYISFQSLCVNLSFVFSLNIIGSFAFTAQRSLNLK